MHVKANEQCNKNVFGKHFSMTLGGYQYHLRTAFENKSSQNNCNIRFSGDMSFCAESSGCNLLNSVQVSFHHEEIKRTRNGRDCVIQQPPHPDLPWLAHALTFRPTVPDVTIIFSIL
jgi:hypothetical protein